MNMYSKSDRNVHSLFFIIEFHVRFLIILVPITRILERLGEFTDVVPLKFSQVCRKVWLIFIMVYSTMNSSGICKIHSVFTNMGFLNQ